MQFLVQISKPGSLIIDLLHGFWLVLLNDLVQPLLSSDLIVVKLSRQLLLILNLQIGVAQSSFEIDEELRILNLLKSASQLGVLSHQVCNCLVSVKDLLVSCLDSI